MPAGNVDVLVTDTLMFTASTGDAVRPCWVKFRNTDGANPIFVTTGEAAATTSKFEVPAGQSIELSLLGGNTVRGIATGGTVSVDYISNY